MLASLQDEFLSIWKCCGLFFSPTLFLLLEYMLICMDLEIYNHSRDDLFIYLLVLFLFLTDKVPKKQNFILEWWVWKA